MTKSDEQLDRVSLLLDRASDIVDRLNMIVTRFETATLMLSSTPLTSQPSLEFTTPDPPCPNNTSGHHTFINGRCPCGVYYSE